MFKSLFKILLLLILLLFTASYITASSGYYEYTIRDKMIVTNDRIKEFEEDVKNNKDIDIKNYMDYKEVDYSNRMTKLVYNISDSSNKIAKKTIKYLFKKLSDLMEE